MLVGLGGAHLSLSYTPGWTENLTGGRGWIAVALVIFATWDPGRAVLGALVFGGINAIQFRMQAAGDHPRRVPGDAALRVHHLRPRDDYLAGVCAQTGGCAAALGLPYVRGAEELNGPLQLHYDFYHTLTPH